MISTEDILHAIAGLTINPKLTAWEARFVDEMAKRKDKGMFLTSTQLEHARRIYHKYFVE
jgi:hypothetical protein